MTCKVRILQNRLQGDAICCANSVRVMLTVCLPVVAFVTHMSVGEHTLPIILHRLFTNRSCKEQCSSMLYLRQLTLCLYDFVLVDRY
jgi:Na+(H+)/acetate symporter ActP